MHMIWLGLEEEWCDSWAPERSISMAVTFRECVGGLQWEGIMVMWRVLGYTEAATKHHLQGNLTSTVALFTCI